ncbi:outer membrane protein [Aestuariivirga sp.]|uniref:outer membrane protein n=1 Tax=Aestuariivirga sp. TaxID=2650926 RepID=UPI003BADA933
MKSITKALLGIGMLAGLSGTAFAADAYTPEAVVSDSAFYIRGDLGWSWLNTDDNSNSAFVGGGGVGYKFNSNLRADVRGDLAGLGNGDQYFNSVLGNVYFDIPTQTIVTPYLGAGVGYGWSDDGDKGGKKDGAAFAAMAGIEVSLTDNLSADIGYRYRQIFSEDVYANEALVGLRYSF